MVKWIVRVIFVLMIVSVLFFNIGRENVSSYGEKSKMSDWESLSVLVVGSIILLLGLAIDILLPKKNLAALAGIFFGLVVGLLVGLAFNYVLEYLYDVYGVHPESIMGMAKEGIKLSLNILCCYLAITFIMQTKDDFRFIIPYVEFTKQIKGVGPLLLDTSGSIDGRISDIAMTKIIDSPIIIPRFILNELQNIADSADRLKRNRGRRGLDILNKMQSNKEIDIKIEDIALTTTEQAEPVDHKLVSAAQKLGGKVVTNDYNLNKVASLRGVDVINIHDLANAMKPVVLPGETMTIKILKPGDQAGQGVGYLDDGTMVVVENGRAFMGREIELIVTSVLQTSAGRMIFGKFEENNSVPAGGSRDNGGRYRR